MRYGRPLSAAGGAGIAPKNLGAGLPSLTQSGAGRFQFACSGGYPPHFNLHCPTEAFGVEGIRVNFDLENNFLFAGLTLFLTRIFGLIFIP